MRLAGARVIKLVTDDGQVTVHKSSHIGSCYLVDLDSIQIATAKNLGLNYRNWVRTVIFDSFGNWIPTELIEFIEANEN